LPRREVVRKCWKQEKRPEEEVLASLRKEYAKVKTADTTFTVSRLWKTATLMNDNGG